MISKQIKDLRKQHNYTQEELAEKWFCCKVKKYS